MNEPWIRHRNVPIVLGTPVGWPVGARGWLSFLGLAVIWPGAANVISLTIMPGKPIIVWSAIMARALVIVFVLARSTFQR